MQKRMTKKLTLTALFAAIIAVAAPISIPVGPIPITLAVFAIFLCGALLPPLYSVSATLVYIALGAVGLPVFSKFAGGFQVLIGATGGFIWAYPLMALVIALSVKLFKKRSVLSLAVGMVTALLICYSLGTLWFIHLLNYSFIKGLQLCVIPFILPDLAKAIIAITLTLGLNKYASFNKEI